MHHSIGCDAVVLHEWVRCEGPNHRTLRRYKHAKVHECEPNSAVQEMHSMVSATAERFQFYLLQWGIDRLYSSSELSSGLLHQGLSTSQQ